MIITSALAAIVETVPLFFRNAREFWLAFETLILVIFSLEFLLRCYAHSSNLRQFWRFILSPYTIIDILAICPFFVKLVLYKGEFADVHRITVLRLFRLLRLFRCYTYSSLLQLSIDALILSVSKSIDALIALLVFLTFTMISFSTLMYFAERGTWDPIHRIFKDVDGLPSQFSSIPASLWFVTEIITTVGLGDIHPKTVLGKAIATPLMMLSLLIIALPSIVIGRNFAESWAWLRSTRPARPSMHIISPTSHHDSSDPHRQASTPALPSPAPSATTNSSAPLHHRQAHFFAELSSTQLATQSADQPDHFPLPPPSTSVGEHGEVSLAILQELQRQNELLERLMLITVGRQYHPLESRNLSDQRSPSAPLDSHHGNV